MVPTASVLIPTRRRRSYLGTALASVAPQAAARGAEVVVVEDDPADGTTAALVEGHGARYVPLGAPRGLNAARNAAIEAAAGELLCFVDDDVAVWPGWLDALLAAAAANPGHEAFGGPIRPVLEGAGLHACGREPLPVTSLDLGPEDRDAELVWGANLAVRRSAIERVGPFDPARSGPGDEEEWERRLRAAGGRIRYVAAAGVDHRRTGADARIRGLSRAAWHRGRHGRRYDEEKGVAPSLPAELRTLAGCVWHTARRRCGVGIVLAAQTAGRIAEALMPRDRERSAALQGADDRLDRPYLAGQSGTLGRRGLLAGRARDLVADAQGAPRRRELRAAARSTPPRRRVHVVGIVRPEQGAVADAIAAELSGSRHDVALHLAAGAPGLGKWENLRAAAQPPPGTDWLLVVDDDVVLPRRFLDVFLHVAEAHGLQLAQPAHAFASHAAWPVTRRRPGLAARRTRFVEIGPVTAVHSDAFAALLPFPALRMGWGLDAHWSAAAAGAGLALGVVDATPVRHLRPVASSYPHAAAVAEADAFLAGRPHVTRAQAAEVLEAWR